MDRLRYWTAPDGSSQWFSATVRRTAQARWFSDARGSCYLMSNIKPMRHESPLDRCTRRHQIASEATGNFIDIGRYVQYPA